MHIHENVGRVALRTLLLFSFTYLCEGGFSTLVSVKKKCRNKLDCKADMRCALSSTTGVSNSQPAKQSSLLRPTAYVMSPTARSIAKKKVITPPASPHSRPSSGIVDQELIF